MFPVLEWSDSFLCALVGFLLSRDLNAAIRPRFWLTSFYGLISLYSLYL